MDQMEEAYRADPDSFARRRSDPARAERRFSWVRRRVTRTMADLDYYRDSPLGWRHGVIIVWAGMRGVVTLAAAQTLPSEGVTDRPLLIFVAFLVALFSLLLQGLTLAPVVRAVGLSEGGGEGPRARSSTPWMPSCVRPRSPRSPRARSHAATGSRSPRTSSSAPERG